MPTRAILFVPVISVCSCISNTVVNIGQKSSLERQLMGEVEPLTETELLVASVRESGSPTLTAQDEPLSRALAARRRQLFNRDDVEELKTAGCLGEAADGRLVTRSCEKSKAAEIATLSARVVDEENADRSAIIDWALGVDPVLTRSDRPQVVALYHRLVVDRAKPGEWLQQADGSWAQR